MRALIVGAISSAAVAASAQESKIFAVLPLSTQNSTIAPSARESLEESIRNAASDALRPLGLTVLTAASTLRYLTDNGIDPACLEKAACPVDLGKELKARYIISGAITSEDGVHSAFVRIYDVTTSGMLSAIKLRGRSGRDLEDAFDAHSAELFEKAGLVKTTAPPVATLVPKPAAGTTLVIASVPPGALIVVDGAEKGETPLAIQGLSGGDHVVELTLTNYQQIQKTVTLTAGATTKERIELQLLEGRLQISAVTSASCTVGPRSVSLDAGGLEIVDLPVGAHPLSCSAAGRETLETTVRISAGGMATYTVELADASPATKAALWHQRKYYVGGGLAAAGLLVGFLSSPDGGWKHQVTNPTPSVETFPNILPGALLVFSGLVPTLFAAGFFPEHMFDGDNGAQCGAMLLLVPVVTASFGVLFPLLTDETGATKAMFIGGNVVAGVGLGLLFANLVNPPEKGGGGDSGAIRVVFAPVRDRDGGVLLVPTLTGEM